MHPHRDAAPLDVLGQFEEVEEDNPIPGTRGLLLSSVGVLAVIVVGSIGFVSGTLWGAAHEPDLDYGNVAAELTIKIAYAALWGALVAAFLVALVFLGLGWVWIRGRMDARRAESRPADEAPEIVSARRPARRATPPRHH